MSDKERAEFEAWCKSIGFTVDKNCFGEYRYGYGHELYSGWQASAARYQSRIAELEAETARLKADSARIDWLADPCNHIGNVSLPAAIVERNLPILRDAIDEAMKGGA